jgi:hypothetical protein
MRASGPREANVPVGICSARYIANLWQNPHDRPMSYKLPSLTSLARPRIRSVSAPLGLSPMLQLGLLCLLAQPCAAAGEGPVDGQQLVAQAARNVQAESSIKANLRYRVDAFGRQLVGSGSYLQYGSGAEKLLRLELKTQVGEQVASLQEICGSQFFWVRRDLPQGAHTLGRVNLAQLRRAIAQSQKTPSASPGQTWIMLGGLPKLLEGLNWNFQFEPARAEEIEFALPGGQVKRMPVWMVGGAWKPEALAALVTRHGAESPAELPEQIPSRVELVLGRVEQAFPLFPYRITYLRKKSVAGSEAGQGGVAGPAEYSPLIDLELFEVYRKDDLDPREFEYNPGDQEVEDLTLGYMKRLGVDVKR